MELIHRVKSVGSSEDAGRHFVECAWKLYEDAFPEEERRDFKTHCRVLRNKMFHSEILTYYDKFAGIFFWWDFGAMRYIEHFAIDPALRGLGLGSDLINEYTGESDVPVFLEVEIPDDNIKLRRIEFYERSGFVLNRHEYFQPPYREGGSPLRLYLMTYPEGIDEQQVRLICRICHPVLFKNLE